MSTVTNTQVLPSPMANPTVFSPNATTPASITNPPTINVKMGDYLVLPALSDCARLTIAWSQDRSPRTAEYVRELVLPSLSDRVPLHLGHTTRKEEACLKEPNSETKKVQNRANTTIDIKSPWIKVNPDWQYGVLSDKSREKTKPSMERFIVYHPKSRTPFTKRFDMAQTVPQGAFINVINGASNVSAGSMSASDSWGIGNFCAIGLSMLACQSVAQGLAVPYMDKKTGKYLKDFTPGEVASN
ncbi:hypothetical protein DER46DRAFT_664873 [Fusarium sp. MPI-SDFR-AT-0072]|nr:hypothetical protein DER46DRAFT_664873 [Fusarium sp. MPI-SDFR-AT-0072]